MKKLIQDEGCNLKIGTNDKKKEIYIPHNSRFLNTLVLGNKGTGKSSLILKEFAHQTIADRNVGGTFIVSSKDLSYELYILAKHYKRRVMFINPSVSNDVDFILNKENFSIDDITSKFNFEKYIFNNYIVIIDLENVITGTKGIQFTSLLLDALKNSISNTDITCSRPHFLYIDDAFYYLDYLQDILYYGNEYNLATTLFFQNRSQFKNENKDYTSLIDSNTGNLILTNHLTLSDSKFYGEILDINLVVCSRNRGKIFYEFKNKDGARFSGGGEIKESLELESIIREELYPTKRALKKKKEKMLKKIDAKNDDVDLNVNLIKPEEFKENECIADYNNDIDDRVEHISAQEYLNDVQNCKQEILDIDREDTVYEDNNLDDSLNKSVFDDGKIELTFDWDDDDF